MAHRNDGRGLDPREFPEPDETDAGHMPCPHCMAVIFDESERCPACGQYLSEEDTPLRKPVWIIIGVLICLALAVMWIWPKP